MDRRLALLILAVIVGAILGSLLGQLFATFLPVGAVRSFMAYNLQLGFSPVLLDLAVFDLTLGLHFRINFMAIVGIIVTIYYFKWWF